MEEEKYARVSMWNSSRLVCGTEKPELGFVRLRDKIEVYVLECVSLKYTSLSVSD